MSVAKSIPKQKILIVTDAWLPQLNGVVRTYEYLKIELEKMGHDVFVIGPCDFQFRFTLPGYKEIELAIAPLLKLTKLINAIEPDVIHIATEATLGRAAKKYCMKRNIAFTTSYHTHFPDYVAKRIHKILPFLSNWVRNRCIAMLRRFHRDSAAIMIATQSLEDELKSWSFTAPMYRLTRGAQIDLFYPAKTDIYNDLPKPIALYVGRVAIEKNLEAFLDMDWDGSKVIIGEGPDLRDLQNRYDEAHFMGKKTGKDLGMAYQGADIFVFPSKTDTFGMVLIEALSCGVPIAAYNVTGPKDIITDPTLGVLDNKDLGTAAKKALKTPGTAQDRHDYVLKHYTWPIAAEQFIEIAQKQ